MRRGSGIITTSEAVAVLVSFSGVITHHMPGPHPCPEVWLESFLYTSPFLPPRLEGEELYNQRKEFRSCKSKSYGDLGQQGGLYLIHLLGELPGAAS